MHFESGSDTTNKDDGLISFRTASAGTRVERVRITSSGDMGVGTETPDRKLDVSGTGNVYGKFQSTNATGAGIEVKDTSERWLIQADGGVGPGLAFYDLGRTAYRFILGYGGQLGLNGANWGTSGNLVMSGGTTGAASWSSGLTYSTSNNDPKLVISGSGHAQLTLTSTSGTDHCGVNFGDSADHNACLLYTSPSPRDRG